MTLGQVQLKKVRRGQRLGALGALVHVQRGIVGLEVQQLRERCRALGRGAGERGERRVQKGLNIVLCEEEDGLNTRSHPRMQWLNLTWKFFGKWYLFHLSLVHTSFFTFEPQKSLTTLWKDEPLL